MTVSLIVVEACAIALLAVLVVGLLRNQRQILAALSDLEARSLLAPTAVAPTADLVGTSPTGEAVTIDLAADADRTLLAFLSSTCVTCRGLWGELAGDLTGQLPAGTRVVIVTEDGADERADAVRDLAPPRVAVVMSSATWRRYGVTAAPYFALVEGSSGRVLARGTAADAAELARLVRTRAGS